MEAICKHLAERAKGKRKWTPGEQGDTFMPAMQELHALGWVRNESKPEPTPDFLRLVHGPTVFPWWTDPETGEDVRGLANAMQVAFDRHMNNLG